MYITQLGECIFRLDPVTIQILLPCPMEVLASWIWDVLYNLQDVEKTNFGKSVYLCVCLAVALPANSHERKVRINRSS